MAWHARLSASTAKRWINCPGSIRAIEELYAAHPQLKERDEKSSPYAAEGTDAHHLFEYCLKPLEQRFGDVPVDPMDMVGGAITPDGAVVTPEQVVRMLADWREITEDMATAVACGVDYVVEELDRLGPGVELYLERTWDMTWLHPDLGGTSDATLDLFLEELCVFDYKHGKGVVVEVVDEKGNLNEQGMTYLLSAARKDGFTHERYKLAIIQPRAPHADGPVREKTVTRQELLDFMRVLLAAAEETASPNAALRAGSWCFFCPKSGNCPAQDERVMEAAGADFDDLPLEGQELAISGRAVDVDQVAIKLKWVPIIDAWARGVETLAQRLAESGTRVPGQKLVRKKTNRKLRDDAALREQAEAMGLDPLKIYQEPKAKTPAQIEKLGKPWKSLVNAVDPGSGQQLYWYKPAGQVTLAPETDAREEVDPSAVSDFDELPDDDAD